jgi:hypothetical protein
MRLVVVRRSVYLGCVWLSHFEQAPRWWSDFDDCELPNEAVLGRPLGPHIRRTALDW